MENNKKSYRVVTAFTLNGKRYEADEIVELTDEEAKAQGTNVEAQ